MSMIIKQYNDNVDAEFEQFVRKLILDYYNMKTEIKYRQYEKNKKDNEIFVHEILEYVFKLPKFENDNPPTKIIIGDIVDDFLKSVFKTNDTVLRLPYNYNGTEYIIIGKPDAIVQFRNRTYILEFKYSDRLYPYHILQTMLYVYLYRKTHNDSDVRGCIVIFKSSITLHFITYIESLVTTAINEYLKSKTSDRCCQ